MLEEDLAYKKDKNGDWIYIEEGSPVAVTSAGKLRGNGTVKIEGDKWEATIGTKSKSKTKDGETVKYIDYTVAYAD